MGESNMGLFLRLTESLQFNIIKVPQGRPKVARHASAGYEQRDTKVPQGRLYSWHSVRKKSLDAKG
jgi:hypothetical protein